MNQFDLSYDKNGDLVMAKGWLHALRSGVRIEVPGSEVRAASSTPEEGLYGASWKTRPALVFVGGSGRNIILQNPPGTAAPVGHFRPTVAATWEGVLNPDLVLSYDSGAGTAAISDGTDDIATGTGFTVAPVGSFTLTTYGEDNYNGGDPGSLDTDWEGGGTIPGARIEVSGGTLTIQDFTATTVDAYVGDDDSDFEIAIAGDGSAVISDATDDIAERAAGGSLYDPTGNYVATSYGRTTYHSGDAFNVLVSRKVGVTIAGYVYVIVTESGAGVPSSVSAPVFAATLPTNADPIFYVPIGYSDGAGGIIPYQQGPIYWA